MRVFISIEISDDKILKKIQTFQEDLEIDAEPTRIDQIHFTLQFLGEIDDMKCKEVKDVLNKISFSQFELSLKGVGGFPHLNNPRVIWIGTDKGGQKLSEIAKKIGVKVSILGFKEDEKFKPHLTIFRVKKRINDISSLMKEIGTVEFGTQMISQIKLKKSVLSPKGPEYSDLLVVNAK
jgi:2'-5' RNA ligase|tara:strand:+ start:2873 stop:3409 length:537 start_codon:yes stop_codon:yes gene_type:complete